MLQILLLILKILGIVLLAILGIVLAVLLLVLFVPVRYRVDGSFDGKPQGGAMVSWLLHLVTVRVNYDGSVKALVKILWFKVFNQTVWSPDGDDGEAAEEIDGVEETAEDGLEELPDVHVTEIAESDVPAKKQGATEPKPAATESKPAAKGETAAAPKANVTKSSVAKSQGEAKAQIETQSQAEVEEKAPIEKAVEKICVFIDKISGTYEQTSEKIHAVQAKINQVRAFLSNAENQNTIKLLLGQVLKLLKHVLPKKIQGRVKFGFEDPYTTGQVLTYISPFYGLYTKSLDIDPVFDEKVMEGELHIKGRIRLGSLIWIVVRVFFNKNFRKLLRAWRSRSK